MDLTVIAKKYFLTLPSLTLVDAVRRKDKDATLNAFDQDLVLKYLGPFFAPGQRPWSRASLHLAGLIRLPSTRSVAVVRAISYEATVFACEGRIYDALSLRFTHAGDGLALRRALRDDALRGGIEHAALGARPGILFPETEPGDPAWMELDLRTRRVETIQMNGFDDGFNDELYLMSLVGEFDDAAPHSHWLFDLERAKALPPHIPHVDLST